MHWVHVVVLWTQNEVPKASPNLCHPWRENGSNSTYIVFIGFIDLENAQISKIKYSTWCNKSLKYIKQNVQLYKCSIQYNKLLEYIRNYLSPICSNALFFDGI